MRIADSDHFRVAEAGEYAVIIGVDRESNLDGQQFKSFIPQASPRA